MILLTKFKRPYAQNETWLSNSRVSACNGAEIVRLEPPLAAATFSHRIADGPGNQAFGFVQA
jgi:hypothetical protein